MSFLARLAGVSPEAFNRIELAARAEPFPGAWLVVAVLAAAAALLAWWSVRRARGAPRYRLLGLRLVALAALLFIVLGPAIELQKAVPVASRVAVLIDNSRSMELPDGEGSRLDAARRFLATEGVQRLFEGRRVDAFAFGGELVPVAASAIATLEPVAEETAIGKALEELARNQTDAGLAAVLLVSDGASPDLFAPGAIELKSRRWPGVPVLVHPVGTGAGFKDLAVTRLAHQSFGFVRHELSFDATLVARGLAGSDLTVTLKENGALISSQNVSVRAELEELPLHFSFVPARTGDFLYTIATAVLPEEVVTLNNQVSFPVSIRRDQIRVLQLAGRPSWDVRFLRTFLKQDPNVDLVSFFILRDFDDPPGVPQDELSLIPFPVTQLFSSELDEFDVIIFQDFNRRQFLSDSHLYNLETFVNQGGGFLMVGGELSFGGGGFAATPVESILPVGLPGGAELTDLKAARPQLTEAGAHHYITRLEASDAANRQLWEALEPLAGVNLVGGVRGGAVALLEHPERQAGGVAMPILAARSVGRGRTLALMADSSWYWSFRAAKQAGTPRVYNELVRNAIRWLAHEETSRFVALELSRDRVEPGAAIELRVLARAGDYTPLAGARLGLEVAPAEGGPPVLNESGVAGSDGRLKRSLALQAEGFYRVKARLEEPSGKGLIDETAALFEVRADVREFVEAAPRPDVLARIAELSGGQVLDAASPSPDLTTPEVYRITERRELGLWDNGLAFGLLLGALGAEWWLRRRSGLP